ncbi:ATP-binding cassette domain-containing protein [Streptomyces sp. Je 1-4]|uniref:ATP-binding cassette domain-containing protein n=1 Tax=Streptomyces TaxID=1883 RepID=UPI0021D83F46|nr:MULTISPECIES: ATP-binding cassette domain-containing protein [unclassified Streptomyces]UYB42910.1 ATP-binding cassette domain-containing protein [Streptomyces sp. Je 1-4]UZQ39248.1 ATP-binding cassette domain-containing protein [Streptomyces sp. Je 1-4] [Streptomyces sp. Je 1-4 4N24]UZQ46665.1 ATP-binding cassette domain-containing protein [Streptomyces sp. Je 1-4] [Streptomyces sp. Je 1-4 4N24_ara]
MDSTPHGAAVTAAGFGVKGPRGWAFRNIDFTAGPGSLIAVQGPSGSGRTCLLLALTGRMKSAAGTAEVGGLPLPKKKAAVRSVTALAHVPGVAELDPALTVGEHLRERALLQGRFGGSLRALLRPRQERRAAARALVDAALSAAGLDLETLPKGIRTSVRDLERLEALRLSVALALIGGPRLLAVDDTDLKLSDDERAAAWKMLHGLAAAGTTVLAVCSEPPEGDADVVLVRTGSQSEPSSPEGAPGTPTATPDVPDARDTTDTTGTSSTTDSKDGEAGAAEEGGQGGPSGSDGTGSADSADGTPAGAPAADGHGDEEGAADALAETGRA